MARQSDAFYDDGTELSPLDSIAHILAQIASNTGDGAGGGGVGVLTVQKSWVRHSILLNNSAQVIPAGAFYQYTVLTGTAGDGAMSGLPAGYSDFSQVPITSGFTITANSASTVAVVWWTKT